MRLNSQNSNQYYLDSMGIVSWQQRQSRTLHVSLQREQRNLSLLACCDGQYTDAQQILWDNIKESLCHFQLLEDAALADHVIIFGSGLSCKLTAKHIKVVPSLEDIVIKPKLKADVWNAIRDSIAATS